MQQARSIARRQWLLGDKFSGKVIIEIRNQHGVRL
jgi:hypothetical protein